MCLENDKILLINYKNLKINANLNHFILIKVFYICIKNIVKIYYWRDNVDDRPGRLKIMTFTFFIYVSCHISVIVIIDYLDYFGLVSQQFSERKRVNVDERKIANKKIKNKK